MSILNNSQEVLPAAEEMIVGIKPSLISLFPTVSLHNFHLHHLNLIHLTIHHNTNANKNTHLYIATRILLNLSILLSF